MKEIYFLKLGLERNAVASQVAEETVHRKIAARIVGNSPAFYCLQSCEI